MHSCLLPYKGYTIVVENYIYKLAIDPTKTFITLDDMMGHIDNMENRFENVMSKLKKSPNEKETDQ
jgi:hypothetical protein